MRKDLVGGYKYVEHASETPNNAWLCFNPSILAGIGSVYKDAGHVNPNWRTNLAVGMYIRTDFGGNFEQVLTITRIYHDQVDVDDLLRGRTGTPVWNRPIQIPTQYCLPASVVQ